MTPSISPTRKTYGIGQILGPAPLIAFLEGITTLGLELYALRVCASTIGSSTAVTGMVLGAILIALSIGYWRGGEASEKLSAAGKQGPEVMQAITWRLGQAVLLYGLLIPLHRPVMDFSYDLLGSIELSALLSALLYVPGVMRASSVLPLLAESRGGSNGQSAGSFLAISTIGSVVGSTAVPVLLFPSVGVRLSGMILIGLLVSATLIAAAGTRRGTTP